MLLLPIGSLNTQFLEFICGRHASFGLVRWAGLDAHLPAEHHGLAGYYAYH